MIDVFTLPYLLTSLYLMLAAGLTPYDVCCFVYVHIQKNKSALYRIKKTKHYTDPIFACSDRICLDGMELKTEYTFKNIGQYKTSCQNFLRAESGSFFFKTSTFSKVRA